MNGNGAWGLQGRVRGQQAPKIIGNNWKTEGFSLILGLTMKNPSVFNFFPIISNIFQFSLGFSNFPIILAYLGDSPSSLGKEQI